MVDSRQVLATGALAVLLVVLVWAAGCGGPAQDAGTTTPTMTSTDVQTTTGSQPTTATNGGGTDGTSGPTELFSPAGECAPCHSTVPSDGPTEVDFHGDWSQSMMAEAAEDPYFRAKVVTEIEAFPEHEALIESKCLACHMPMGRRQATEDGATLDFQTVVAGDSAHQQLAVDGVSCTVCHQIQDDRLGTPARFSGNFTIDTATAKPNRSIFGPYPPVSGELMQGSSGFAPVESQHMGSAALCGACHTLYTPTLDESGAIVGSFPEQTPYLEWQQSTYDGSTPCQSCHMPQVDDTALSSVPSGLPKRTVNQHQFAGANAQMATVLGNDDGANRSMAMLGQYVGISVQEVTRTEEGLEVTVRVRNGAGHKFPTGFPSRRAWIRLSVTAEDGTTIFDSGAVSQEGAIAARDAPFEPHHERITSEDQVQIYQSVMENVDGEVTRTLLRAAGYAKDNRIPPMGFQATEVPSDIAVRGAATADGNFQGGSDTVTYVIETDAASPTVSATLLFQPVSKPFLDAERESSDPIVTGFLEEYERVNGTTVVDRETVSVSG